MITSRRKFLTGMSALIAAPAIVRVASIMPVRGYVLRTNVIPVEFYGRSPARDALPGLREIQEMMAIQINMRAVFGKYAAALNTPKEWLV